MECPEENELIQKQEQSCRVTVATVTTIRASLEETLAFVSYHLRTGVDHMYLFFDDPEDEAIYFLEGDSRVTCVRCDERHVRKCGLDKSASLQKKQNANATYAFKDARRRGAEWLVYLDSDELLYCRKPTNEFFSAMEAEIDVVLFPVMEAVPQKLRYHRPFEEISLFKFYPKVAPGGKRFEMGEWDSLCYKIWTKVWHLRKRMATALGVSHSQIIGHFILGHSVGKSAVRTSSNISPLNSHLPAPEGNRELRLRVPFNGALLHFDCRGYGRWREKWERRVTGKTGWNTTRFSHRRKKQRRQFREAYSQESERALRDLYKRWYFMPDYERTILEGLGLVKEIDLSLSLFERRDH